jgi:hypothetical protein
MTLLVVALLVVAASLAGWVMYRAARLRREAESREARVLEALFAARHSANGGATIDVDEVFGRAPAAAAPTSADDVLRAAGLGPEVIALVGKQRSSAPAVEPEPDDAKAPTPPGAADHDRDSAARGLEATGHEGDVRAAGAAPVPVRDLVQVFYEARGFRAAPADASARPVALVLTHKSDPRRSYAFAPIDGTLTEADLRSVVETARRIDQSRVLIAVEGTLAPALGSASAEHGVRAFDRAAIEAQLARVDAAAAEKLRAAAARRAARRMEVA